MYKNKFCKLKYQLGEHAQLLFLTPNHTCEFWNVDCHDTLSDMASFYLILEGPM